MLIDISNFVILNFFDIKLIIKPDIQNFFELEAQSFSTILVLDPTFFLLIRLNFNWIFEIW